MPLQKDSPPPTLPPLAGENMRVPLGKVNTLGSCTRTAGTYVSQPVHIVVSACWESCCLGTCGPRCCANRWPPLGSRSAGCALTAPHRRCIGALLCRAASVLPSASAGQVVLRFARAVGVGSCMRATAQQQAPCCAAAPRPSYYSQCPALPLACLPATPAAGAAPSTGGGALTREGEPPLPPWLKSGEPPWPGLCFKLGLTAKPPPTRCARP